MPLPVTRSDELPRRIIRLVAALLVAASLLSFAGGSVVGTADAQEATDDGAQDDGGQDDGADQGVIPVIQVSGLLDPIVADYVIAAVDRAIAQDASIIVLQVESEGSVLSTDDLIELARVVKESPIPVAAWVGPSGVEATGHVAQLVAVADRIGVSFGSTLGDTGPQVLPEDEFGVLYGPDAPELETRAYSSEELLEVGITPARADVLGDFLLSMNDLGVDSEAVDAGTQIEQRVVFERLGLFAQQLHTIASPPVAYLLLLTGLGLFVFEFFTAGIGIAGMIGAGSFLFSMWGLGILPTNWWAVAALIVSAIAFGVDVQTGVPRFWSVVGVVLLVVGSFTLYSGMRVGWLALLVGIVGMILSMIAGMPAMTRTRFSTPTIGRKWIIGKMGIAVGAIDPDGVVAIDDALWKARTNRATPLEAGDRIRVVALDGLILEVEPEEGGAIDYRERRKSSDDQASASETADQTPSD